MAGFQKQTNYKSIGSYYEDTNMDSEIPHVETEMIHMVPERSKARWNHIENLDEFFTRVYHYHQRAGFLCMVAEEILQLVQFVFVVVFSAFLLNCVNYDVLFANVHYNTTHKVTINEAVYNSEQCLGRFDFTLIVCLIIAAAFWLLRLVKVVYNIFKYYEIRSFFLTALKISASDLPNMTWHEVQRRLLEVQKEQQMCVHKTELTELDIYHRILRFKNYLIAMVNKEVLPVKYNLPFIGEYAFLSTGLKYNLEMILFWGPWSPFENNWHLRDEYKITNRRIPLGNQLSSRFFWHGVANLLLCPVIFLWQILYFFFRYGELIKRKPGALGARRWSNYSRHYLRHFNEVDHEFDARLSRAYGLSNLYLNIFTSPFLVILAKNTAFFAGSVLAVLVVLTVVDEDVLSVEHMLTTMTIAGVIVTVCSSLIPEEHMIYCPERLMRNILAHIHYMPDHWNGVAHTYKVRDEFSLLFQYKASYLIEELLSPIITPFILCFYFSTRSLQIVDFFRNFTVEVVGVGDVCSFAQMDVRKHGSPQWGTATKDDITEYQQAEDGKTELSLMHFHLTNPEWKPPDNCSLFINNVKDQAHRDIASMSTMQFDNPAASSLYGLSVALPSLGPGLGFGYSSMISSITGQSAINLLPSTTVQSSASCTKFRGAVSNLEIPPGSTSGILTSMHSSAELQPSSMGFPGHSMRQVDEGTIELMSADMSFSALYMHELRRRRPPNRAGIQLDTFDESRLRMMHRQDSNTPHTPVMPEIQEKSSEEEERERLTK
ncbi:hypothetical protein SNE40_022905 [Patella caerulea]|uniref:Autophagy-related protein 9 n=1 Tax=Patella caerulea TaxID=87958 RepID=A0AAN8IWC3_PATCE